MRFIYSEGWGGIILLAFGYPIALQRAINAAENFVTLGILLFYIHYGKFNKVIMYQPQNLVNVINY